MKNIILTILRTGCTTTKKYSVSDLVKFFYPLKHILKKESENGLILCNGNSFWKFENRKNISDLIHDFMGIQKSLTKGTMFSIINRFENGDVYGITKEA